MEQPTTILEPPSTSQGDSKTSPVLVFPNSDDNCTHAVWIWLVVVELFNLTENGSVVWEHSSDLITVKFTTSSDRDIF